MDRDDNPGNPWHIEPQRLPEGLPADADNLTPTLPEREVARRELAAIREKYGFPRRAA